MTNMGQRELQTSSEQIELTARDCLMLILLSTSGIYNFSTLEGNYSSRKIVRNLQNASVVPLLHCNIVAFIGSGLEAVRKNT